MFPTKIAGDFLITANTAGTINSAASLAAALKLPRGAVDLFELRLDAFAETAQALLQEVPRLKAPLLITARHFKEGGMVPLTASKRAALYEAFIPHAALIDVELRSMKSLNAVLQNARSSGLKVIASFHDFKATPPAERLSQLVLAANHSGADILKIATMTQTPGDVARLLALFEESKIPVSIMGMGRLGKASRLLFAQAGSVVNYGYLDANAQVSGQWAAKLLKERIAEVAGINPVGA